MYSLVDSILLIMLEDILFDKHFSKPLLLLTFVAWYKMLYLCYINTITNMTHTMSDYNCTQENYCTHRFHYMSTYILEHMN